MTKRILSLLLVLALTVMCFGFTAVADEDDNSLKMLIIAQSYDMNTDYVAVTLEELTGVHVDYEYYTDSNQLAMLVANGTDADFMRIINTEYLTLLAQGALKNLAPTLEKFPDLVAAIEPIGWTYVTAEDGGIYGVPSTQDAVYAGGIGYRTDIFEQYGYEEPATIDEFYDLLVAIKEDTGLIPLTGNNAVEEVIASAFGLSYDFVVDDENDTIISWLRLPGMKEYLAWMNKVYNEGLIDIDWPVNTGDTINAKMGSGEAVMTLAYHWSTLGWVNTLVENGYPDAYFKTIVPLEDANGKRHIAVTNDVVYITVVPVTASDEDTEKTLAYLAAKLEPETWWRWNDGIEGVHYTLDEKGIPTPILPKFNEDMAHGSDYWTGCAPEHSITWMARVHKTQVQWDTFYDANSKAAAYGFEGKPLTFASFPEFVEYYTALKTLCNDYFIQVIAGTESLDTYDDFVAEWEANGGLALEQAATEWYHENPELVEAARQSKSPYNDLFGYSIE